MPLGIIEAHSDGPLPGTEYLIGDGLRTGPADVDTNRLKRVLYKVVTAPLL
jgi:hypothetical protein